jgi:hypothetical protein
MVHLQLCFKRLENLLNVTLLCVIMVKVVAPSEHKKSEKMFSISKKTMICNFQFELKNISISSRNGDEVGGKFNIILRKQNTRWQSGNTKRGSINVWLTSCFDWFGICCMTTDNFCFYLQNRLIQTSQTGGQRYSDTSPFSIPCGSHRTLF